MPINRKEAEEIGGRQKQTFENAIKELEKEIVEFLSENSEEMFTAKEIFQAVNVPDYFRNISEFKMDLTMLNLGFVGKGRIEAITIGSTSYYGIRK